MSSIPTPGPAFRLLRGDGSPRGISLVDPRKGGRSPALEVKFFQLSEEQIRWKVAVRSRRELQREFERAVDDITSTLGLNTQQRYTLAGSWPQFYRRNQDKIETIWPHD